MEIMVGLAKMMFGLIKYKTNISLSFKYLTFYHLFEFD
jgi:hypothetical protein